MLAVMLGFVKHFLNEDCVEESLLEPLILYMRAMMRNFIVLDIVLEQGSILTSVGKDC